MAQQDKQDIIDITPKTFYFKTEEGKIAKLKAKTAEEAIKQAENIREEDKKIIQKYLINPFITNPRIHGGSDIDLETIKLRDRLHLKPLSSSPSNPVKGDIYFNTNGHPYSYDGSNWNRIDYIG